MRISGARARCDFGARVRSVPVTCVRARQFRVVLRQSRAVLPVMGLYNRGKTHVLNALMSMVDVKKKQQLSEGQETEPGKLPEGLLTHTQGLSVMLAPNNIMVLDTAGSDQPINNTVRAAAPRATATRRCRYSCGNTAIATCSSTTSRTA